MDKDRLSSKEEKVPMIVLGVVLNKKGEVLIIKRRKPEFTTTGKVLLWAFPGGKQNPEMLNSEQAAIEAVNEILRETGYKVKFLKEIHMRIHPDTFNMIAYFLCELEEDKPVQEIEEKYEVEEVRWVKPEELKNYFTTDIDPEVKKILNIV